MILKFNHSERTRPVRCLCRAKAMDTHEVKLFSFFILLYKTCFSLFCQLNVLDVLDSSSARSEAFDSYSSNERSDVAFIDNRLNLLACRHVISLAQRSSVTWRSSEWLKARLSLSLSHYIEILSVLNRIFSSHSLLSSISKQAATSSRNGPTSA